MNKLIVVTKDHREVETDKLSGLDIEWLGKDSYVKIYEPFTINKCFFQSFLRCAVYFEKSFLFSLSDSDLLQSLRLYLQVFLRQIRSLFLVKLHLR